MSKTDFNSMMYPPNAYTHGWYPSSFHFDNGNIQQTLENVGIRLRGAAARIQFKKGFLLSFSNFEPGRNFYHMKHLNIKHAYGDRSALRNQLVSELFRSSLLPVARGSFASLWINNIFWGVYWICEDFDDTFFKARFKDGTGNFYVGGPKAYMTYLGEDPQVYKNLNFPKFRATHSYYAQLTGSDRSWNDLAQFFTMLNKTSDEDFEETLNGVFDVDQYLQGLVIETMIMDKDGYSNYGNNWGLYHDPESGKWKFLFYDFDLTFGLNYSQSIFTFPCTPDCILLHRIMQVPSFRTKYMEYFGKFVEQIWNPNKNLLVERMITLKNFLQDQIQRDYFFALETSFQEFLNEVAEMEMWVVGRYAAVSAELAKLGELGEA